MKNRLLYSAFTLSGVLCLCTGPIWGIVWLFTGFSAIDYFMNKAYEIGKQMGQ